MPLLHSAVTDRPLDADAHVALVSGARAGALVTFTGMIRDHDPEAEGEVTGIDYSHHPDADALLARIVERVLGRARPGRGGGRRRVAPGGAPWRWGSSPWCAAVATPHRAEAFALCSEVVEAVKAELPIWKHQTEASGRRVWSNLGLGDGA